MSLVEQELFIPDTNFIVFSLTRPGYNPRSTKLESNKKSCVPFVDRCVVFRSCKKTVIFIVQRQYFGSRIWWYLSIWT